MALIASTVFDWLTTAAMAALFSVCLSILIKAYLNERNPHARRPWK